MQFQKSHLQSDGKLGLYYGDFAQLDPATGQLTFRPKDDHRYGYWPSLGDGVGCWQASSYPVDKLRYQLAAYGEGSIYTLSVEGLPAEPAWQGTIAQSDVPIVEEAYGSGFPKGMALSKEGKLYFCLPITHNERHYALVAWFVGGQYDGPEDYNLILLDEPVTAPEEGMPFGTEWQSNGAFYLPSRGHVWRIDPATGQVSSVDGLRPTDRIEELRQGTGDTVVASVTNGATLLLSIDQGKSFSRYSPNSLPYGCRIFPLGQGRFALVEEESVFVFRFDGAQPLREIQGLPLATRGLEGLYGLANKIWVVRGGAIRYMPMNTFLSFAQ